MNLNPRAQRWIYLVCGSCIALLGLWLTSPENIAAARLASFEAQALQWNQSASPAERVWRLSRPMPGLIFPLRDWASELGKPTPEVTLQQPQTPVPRGLTSMSTIAFGGGNLVTPRTQAPMLF